MIEPLLEFLTSPRVVALALLVLLIEAGTLLVLRQHRASLPALDVLLLTLPGLLLLLALLIAVTSASWTGISACLAGAFVAHMLDLRRRFQLTRRLAHGLTQ